MEQKTTEGVWEGVKVSGAGAVAAVDCGRVHEFCELNFCNPVRDGEGGVGEAGKGCR